MRPPSFASHSFTLGLGAHVARRSTGLSVRPSINTPNRCLNSLTVPARSIRSLHSSQVWRTNISARSPLDPLDTFPRRHIGPSNSDIEAMFAVLDPPVKSMDELINQVVPQNIRSTESLDIHRTTSSKSLRAYTESELKSRLMEIASGNKVLRSYIGCGYAGTHVPEVIKRNILEGPGWYTSYTPYQAEISQGRLQSLLNFQTMVCDLTKLPIANASVLDEASAAAEAMTMSLAALPLARQKRAGKTFVVSHLVHPQTLEVLRSRAHGFGITLVVVDVLANNQKAITELGDDLVGVLVQYPNTEGGIEDFRSLSDAVHALKANVCVATDLLALTVLTPPGEFGADIAFGNAQRFGVPFGYGGPHAAFLATTESHKRKLPGRVIGVSKDRLGKPALRLALQTREQHIRREKATSNICTAQALLANMSAMYAVYHGPEGLKSIANRAVASAQTLQNAISSLGFKAGSTTTDGPGQPVLFDTFVVGGVKADELLSWAVDNKGINLRRLGPDRVGITVDETVTETDLEDILDIFKHFAPDSAASVSIQSAVTESQAPAPFSRTSKYLTHPVFNSYHSETELLRYIHLLQSRDLSLTHSMIPLGSCTMKLNGTSEMIPVSWPEFSSLHPFVPLDQAKGYATLIEELEDDLSIITGFDAVSIQPNSGAQGEFAGLRCIRSYHNSQGKSGRDICLIPVSAHGTNPASAAMAGMRIVSIKCDPKTGNLDMADLEAKCVKHEKELGAIMITYPSTFGVFEPEIKEICETVHKYGGQVYMDGANMNAQIGLCSPGAIGADVCHLNLHKTFCIPHGGGGPGVGPIGVKSHLAPFLPGHPLIPTRRGGVDSADAISPISAAPFGSASILPISWAYIKLMAGDGLTKATKATILNANYIMSRLRGHYQVVYTNTADRCAHEFILDIRPFTSSADIQATDVAKRLQDYGFHAPTMSWPVPNTLMIEPTESEGKAELDRFCDALISIRGEIAEIESGAQPRVGNVLRMAPHTMQDLLTEKWDRPYSREKAAYPVDWLRERKFWPSVSRLDDAFGDTNLFCTCPPVEDTV